jgi:hypothetical protein
MFPALFMTFVLWNLICIFCLWKILSVKVSSLSKAIHICFTKHITSCMYIQDRGRIDNAFKICLHNNTEFLWPFGILIIGL